MQTQIQTNPAFSDLADEIGEIDERLNSLDLKDLVPVIVDEVVRVFETEGYGQWPALSPAYKEWKAANYPGQPILRLMDKYFSAATQPGQPEQLHRFGRQPHRIRRGWVRTTPVTMKNGTSKATTAPRV